MISQVDQRRLGDGAKALALPELDTTDKMQLSARLYELHDAIAAMQSLDDLGSSEANQQAWEDMQKLEAEYRKVKNLLDDGEDKVQ